MSDHNIPPTIFDNRRRAALRDRAAQCGSADLFLWRYMADELAERLDCVSRHFEAALIIGPLATMAAEFLPARHGKPVLAPTANVEAAQLGASAITEDRLPFAPEQFDLVIAAGSLDSVNDLPGAMVQIRRTLRPDGLFLASLFGAGTLARLKAAMLSADGERASAHIHPQIELKAASDLLNRAGFALPVADREGLDVRYTDWRRLVADLRAHGIGNALAGPRTYPGKGISGRLDAAWQSIADGDGKVCERFEFLHLSGWSPSPDQPKPAKRGSGKISLAQILPDKSRQQN
jgi:NADH dehydrogenase [ubiquinone] 1 alpha subcomplex assembly factor 5